MLRSKPLLRTHKQWRIHTFFKVQLNGKSLLWVNHTVMLLLKPELVWELHQMLLTLLTCLKIFVISFQVELFIWHHSAAISSDFSLYTLISSWKLLVNSPDPTCKHNRLEKQAKRRKPSPSILISVQSMAPVLDAAFPNLSAGEGSVPFCVRPAAAQLSWQED